MFSGIKAVISDLDDTLFLQKQFKESGFKEVARYLAEEENIPFLESYSCLTALLSRLGPSHPQHFNFFIAQLGIPEKRLPEIIKIFIQHTPDIQCFDGVEKTLEKLKNRFKLGLLTDGRKSVQQRKVTALGIGCFFHTIMYSDSLNLSKPAPPLFQHFEDFFQLLPDQLLYIGDNPLKDFVEPNRRGWKTLRVHTGEYAQLEVSQTYDAQSTLQSFNDLLNHL